MKRSRRRLTMEYLDERLTLTAGVLAPLEASSAAVPENSTILTVPVGSATRDDGPT